MTYAFEAFWTERRSTKRCAKGAVEALSKEIAEALVKKALAQAERVSVFEVPAGTVRISSM